MKGIKLILAAVAAVVIYALLGWLALYLCVVLGVWGAVPDVILIVLLVYAVMWFWQRNGIKWGKVRLALGLFLVPVIVWGISFGILQYKIHVKAMEMVWFAGLPLVLESLSALVCSGLSGVIFLIVIWMQKAKKN